MGLSGAKRQNGAEFAFFHRADGSAVACRVGQIVFVGRGDNGAILNFNGGAQVNVHESFEEVLSMLDMDRTD